MKSSRRRSGLSILDVLVVVAIIGVFFLLVVSATRSAKEAGWRSHCRNNLKQIALSCANYESDNKCYPPGSLPAGIGDGPALSAHARLLPYYSDDTFVFGAINFDHGSSAAANSTARKRMVNTLVCPSDDLPKLDYSTIRNNYLFNAGAGAVRNGTPAGEPNGVVFQNSSVRVSDVADGVSHTATAGESLFGSTTPATTQRIYIASKRAAAPDLSANGGAADFKAGRNLAYDRCSSWMDGTLFQTFAVYRLGVNSARPDFATADYASGAAGLRSMHPGGAHLLLMDGSVLFLDDSTDSSIIEAYATRAGGENQAQ